MKKSKIMEERIRRTRILFKELGYKLYKTEHSSEMYTAGFEDGSVLQGGFYIDRDNKFLEIAYTFSFSLSMADFVKSKLEVMLKISYEYGCYINIQTDAEEIAFSVFTKIYFSGLNFYSLKESLRDFRLCVESLTDVLEIPKETSHTE